MSGACSVPAAVAFPGDLAEGLGATCAGASFAGGPFRNDFDAFAASHHSSPQLPLAEHAFTPLFVLTCHPHPLHINTGMVTATISTLGTAEPWWRCNRLTALRRRSGECLHGFEAALLARFLFAYSRLCHEGSADPSVLTTRAKLYLVHSDSYQMHCPAGTLHK